MALAERTWDTIESGTLGDLKKGHNLKKGNQRWLRLFKPEEVSQQTDASRPDLIQQIRFQRQLTHSGCSKEEAVNIEVLW
jgi:tRNA G37 N-methylase TrmD